MRLRRIGPALVVFMATGLAASTGADPEPIFVHAGRLLDVERGETRPASLLRIESGIVTEILPVSGSELPKTAVDLSHLTVLPGLIDAHVHLCTQTWMGEEWDWWAFAAPTFGILGAVNAERVLNAGFTTVRSTMEYFYCDVALREAIERGWIVGPRIFASGPMITMTGGHGAPGNWMAPQHARDRVAGAAIADGPTEVRRQVRTHIRHGVDLIKIAATGGFGTVGTVPGAASYTEEEIRAAVDEARKRGLAVAAHAHGAEGIRNAVSAGVRSIEHGSLMGPAELELMRNRGVFLVADLLAAHHQLVETPRRQGQEAEVLTGTEEYRRYADTVRRAFEAGVRIAFGTDAGVYPHGRNAEQFALMVEAGIPPLEAIRSATLVAAELLGIEDRAGSLTPGNWADLIAVAEDPLENVNALTDVRFVMQRGEVVRDRARSNAPPAPVSR